MTRNRAGLEAECKGSTSKNNTTTNSGNFLTNSHPFQRLVHWAFSVCDDDQTGELGKAELFAGLLLVHLNLAKYAGPAACYPPSRHVVNQLFDAADASRNGGIDESEFKVIMGICCAQILSRIAVYYAILILFVPYLVNHLTVYFLIEKDSYQELATKQLLSTGIFFVAIPLLWNKIDQASRVSIVKKGTKNQNEQRHQAQSSTRSPNSSSSSPPASSASSSSDLHKRRN